MTVESSFDVQTGLYDHLTANSGLIGLLNAGAGSVLDHVPQGTAFPYIVIGDMSARSLDTQRVAGQDMTVVMHTYSQGQGMAETKAVLSAVYDALHNIDFVVPNQVLILCQHMGIEMRLEPDGKTRRGTIRFRVVTEPA